MAETFCLLELSTLSMLLSACLPATFDCERRALDGRDDSEEIAAPLSIATIDEVLYPVKCVPLA
jgi:hypothetical protein